MFSALLWKDFPFIHRQDIYFQNLVLELYKIVPLERFKNRKDFASVFFFLLHANNQESCVEYILVCEQKVQLATCILKYPLNNISRVTADKLLSFHSRSFKDWLTCPFYSKGF